MYSQKIFAALLPKLYEILLEKIANVKKQNLPETEKIEVSTEIAKALMENQKYSFER